MTKSNCSSPTEFSRRLTDTTQIFSNGDLEFRIRQGVWNFEEAVLDLAGASSHQQDTMIALFNELQSGKTIYLDQLATYGDLTPEEISEVVAVLNDLTEGGYLSTSNAPKMEILAHEILGHELSEEAYANPTDQTQSLLFFSDNSDVIDYAVSLAEKTTLQLSILESDEIQTIANYDLTTRFQAYEAKRDERRLQQRLQPFCGIVGCLERPRVNFLRNLNRALVDISKPLVLSMVDGPFTTIMSLRPPETGCFECYETRLMARMEDRIVYNNFVQSSKNFHSNSANRVSLSLLHGLASQALTEGILIQNAGFSRLAGRVQATYVPLIEVQMQDLLRIPNCPGCGVASHAHMDEMYVSMEKIIQETERRVSVKMG